MPIDQAAIDRLADRLTGDDPAPLSPDEKELLSASLAELAAAHTVIAKQSRLLRLHGELDERIAAIARDALGAVRDHLDAPGPLAGFDASAADAARRTLLTQIESANTTRATLGATLGFVARLFGLHSGG